MTTTISTVDPILRAREVYANEPCARSFDQDLYLHLNTPQCIVFKDATTLALVRPVNSRDPQAAITNPAFISSTPDAWWLYLLVGDIATLHTMFCDHLHNRFKLIGWERNNVPRFYDIQKVKQWTSHLHYHTTSSASTAD